MVTAVLYWLKRENSLKQLCDNRVKEINRTTDRDSWFHCPGKEKLVDIGSQGSFPDEFVNSKQWFNGPKFLQESEENWPCGDTDLEPEFTEKVLKGTKADRKLFTSATKKYSLKDIINVERFSTYRKLLRTTAVVLVDKDSTSKDIEEAERLWTVEEQVENSTECERLEEQLGLYKDEYGVICCQGGLSNSSLPYTTKYPMLLPQKGKLAELIVKDCHYRVNHDGRKETLEQLRSTMWLPKARQFVRKVIFIVLFVKD